MENNKVEFIGTVKRSWSVKTKSGVMSKTLLKVGQSTFWILGHGNVGQAILQLSDGDELYVCGTGQINAWKNAEDQWINEFQVVAWSVSINGEETSFEKQDRKPHKRAESKNSNKPTPQPMSGGNSEFDYKGGPF